MATVLGDLKSIMGQIDCCSPCGGCGPCNPCGGGPIPLTSAHPFAQVLINCPPPCLAPTRPNPVRPLRLPCPPTLQTQAKISPDEAYVMRYSNFYNNYNIDWHADSPKCRKPQEGGGRCPPGGVAVDGKNPHIMGGPPRPACTTDYCPTGFKTCTMQLCPPPCCDPCGVWCATIMPCPPKPKKKVSARYNPGPCRRPCCLHWKPDEPPCCYDLPCKAHCYNHPPGIKPSGRYP